MNWGEVNPIHAYCNGSRTSKDNEDPILNTSSRLRELRRQLQLWKRFGRLHLIVCVLVRNIVVHEPFTPLRIFTLIQQRNPHSRTNALVAPANLLKIRKCNHRLSSDLKSNEPTIQVVLDALKITPFYKAFQITANVPEIYMQEFWATVSTHHHLLHFKMNDKSHTLNVENFIDMLHICPRLPDQRFEDALLREEILSFIRELGHTGEIKIPTNVNVNNMHQSWRLFDPIINSTKLKSKVTKSDMKKQLAKKTKAKGLAVLSKVALLEAEQIKLATKRSKKDFHISYASGLGDRVDTQSKVFDEQVQNNFGTNEGISTIPGVPDVPPYESESDKESWGDSKDEDDNDDDGDNDDDAESDDHDDNSDEERIESDSEEILDPNLTNLDDKETMNDEEDDEVLKELYEDVNVNLEKGIVDKYLASKMKEAVNIVVQLKTNKLREEAQAKNQDFLNQDKMIKTRMKTPSLDQTEGRREGNLVKMLSPLKIQGLRKRSLQAPLKMLPDLNISLSTSLSMQRSQVTVFQNKTCNKIQSLSRGTTMNNPLTRRLPKLTVTRLIIMKKYDYGHLEEIELRRDDQQLYTFKDGDFKRLRLQDIEDIRMVIQKWVEDLQLVVESYQKKLNLTKPDTYRSNLRKKIAYTSHSNPHGIIYIDQFKRKRLMRTDELYKFSDGTLNDVRTALHDIAAGIRIAYLPTRR
nr:hypothetical protein [Tanacetum cinerariifolium]